LQTSPAGQEQNVGRDGARDRRNVMSEPVLVIEPDPLLGASLIGLLSFAGFRPELAADAHAALQLMNEGAFAAIVTELHLPFMTEAGVIPWIRDHAECPLIVTSRSVAEQHRVAILDAGADRFLAKPFSPAELLAILRTLLRRTAKLPPEPTVPGVGVQRTLRAGSLTLDPASRAAAVGGKQVALSPEEFAFLWTLALNSGAKVLPIKLDQVLAAHLRVGRDNVLDIAERVRRKLRQLGDGVQLVQTPRGRGWTLWV
jgi:DNA-binding response OmpR family regulator